MYVCVDIKMGTAAAQLEAYTESALRNACQVSVLGSTSGSSLAPLQHCSSCFHFHFCIRIRIQRSLAEMSSFHYLAVSLILSLHGFVSQAGMLCN